MLYTLVKVKKLVPHPEGQHQTLEEVFVNVPSILYKNALADKKTSLDLDVYQHRFRLGKLKQHNALCNYIHGKVGRFDWADIQRINVIN